jgi:hypothetical protein
MNEPELTHAERQRLIALLKEHGWRWHPHGFWLHPERRGQQYSFAEAVYALGKQMNAEVNILNDGNGYSVGLIDSEGEVDLAEHFDDIDAAEHYAKRVASWFGVRWSHANEASSDEPLG